MDRAGRQSTVEELSKEFSSLSAAFAVDYRGLKVEEATELRRRIRETGAKYRVIKNTLGKRALSGTKLAPLEPHLKGMIGLAFTERDPVALAKTINDFAKDVPAIVFKAGVFADKGLNESQFKALATLPSKEVLWSRLLSVLQAPIQQLLGVLQAPARDLVMVLKAYENEKAGE
ncbi:MAG: 50S ribosomal protein L10 [Vicinamibacteria bacterium]